MKLVYFLLVVFNDFKIVLSCFADFCIKKNISKYFPMPKFSDRKLELAFFATYLIDTYFIQTQNYRSRKLKAKLKDKLKSRLREQGLSPTPIPVPAYCTDKITPDQVDQLLQKKEPFILKGYFSQSFAVQNWTLDYFVKKYGEIPVLAGDPQLNDHTYHPLKDVMQENLYARNVESLFAADPNLAHQIELERLEKYSFAKETWLLSIQLFLASSIHALSGYHNTKCDNYFVQIRGKKKWWFVNPTYTHLMEPFFNKGMSYYESRVGHPENINKECTLYRYAPVMEAEIEAGDLLFSPSLWWHAAKNTTPDNIGVSTRWYSNHMETYYPLSLIQIFNPRFMTTKLRFCREVHNHLKQFKKMVNFHPDRNYASIYNNKTRRTLFEQGSHQMDYKASSK